MSICIDITYVQVGSSTEDTFSRQSSADFSSKIDDSSDSESESATTSAAAAASYDSTTTWVMAGDQTPASEIQRMLSDPLPSTGSHQVYMCVYLYV